MFVCLYFVLFFQHESIEGYCSYIHSVVGFFVVEDHILNTGNGLINRTYLDELWAMALSKIVNALRTHSVSILLKLCYFVYIFVLYIIYIFLSSLN